MINFFLFSNYILLALSSEKVFLAAEIIAFLVGSTILFILINKYRHKAQKELQHSQTFYVLLLVIISTLLENFAWILALIYQFEYLSINYYFMKSITIIAWIFTFVRYQALGIFLENLIENKFTFRWYQKIFLYINMIFIPIYIYTSIAKLYHWSYNINLETILQIIPIYLFINITPSLIIALYKLDFPNIPTIVRKQCLLFLQYIIFPLIFFDMLQCIPFYGPDGLNANTTGIIAVISLLFMTSTIIFAAFHLMRFRIFNFSKKVEDRSPSSLTRGFKHNIESLSLATTMQELILITQNFFEENFKTDRNNVCLNFRNQQAICNGTTDNFCTATSNTIESFIADHHRSISLLKEYKILVADEIIFDAYYSNNQDELKLAHFLHQIKSEIFLPIYDKHTIIAYLMVKRSEQHRFYSLAEQHKIVIFGTYLASAINIMHNSNIAQLLDENKRCKEELYLKHQEINQYKESIKQSIKQKTAQSVGILFYKDKRFSIGNETAQSIISINLNQQKNHPITLALIQLAEQVNSYRNCQTRFLYDSNSQQIMVSGVPHLDFQAGVILTVHYPDSFELVKYHIDKLQDPSTFDYLLYLETTKAGALINQLIPTNHEIMLNFKLKLLKITLHNKATLLQAHHDDMMTIVEIIHTISMRQTLHIIDLQPTNSNHHIGIKLFGLNPLLMHENEEPLLKKLDQIGTLYIKNIDLLDLETQNKLAEYIRYGIFTMCKSEQKIMSNVRIICSLSQNGQALVAQNKLSQTLYNQLMLTDLAMPSLLTMQEKDLHELIDSFALQANQPSHFANLLQLSSKDKDELISARPASLQEFKYKLSQLLSKKSKDSHIFHEKHFDPLFNVTHPQLLHAANLGKHALKDAQIMSMLWQQFGCQNKIAQFLGVNRSSVQRRCKEYNLS